MGTYQYEVVYQALRQRIEAGEFAIGDQLPSIAALQDEYGVSSPGTIRAAHQMLMEDAMIRAEQGRGVFVTSTESARDVSVEDAITTAIGHLQRAQRAIKAQRIRRVTIDFDDPEHPHAYYLLTSLLLQEAADRRADVAEGESNDPDHDLDKARDAEWLYNLVQTVGSTLG